MNSTPLRSLILVLVTLVTSAASSHQTSIEPDPVRRAHAAWFDALLNEDTAALDRLLVDEVTLSFPGGNLMPRPDFLSYLKNGEIYYDSAEHEEAVVRLYGKTGVVTGRSNLGYRFKGTAGFERLRYTAVYVEQDKGWRLVAWHSTKRPE